MSCQTGIQYFYDPSISVIESYGWNTPLDTVTSGQIVTFKSGVEVWYHSGNQSIYKFGPSGLAWKLETGANLYSFDGGFRPNVLNFMPGSGLPLGLGLAAYNKITGTPLKTGVFSCATRYVYPQSDGITTYNYTGTPKQFTVIVCTGGSTGDSFTPNFIPTLGPKFYYDDFDIPCTGDYFTGSIVSIVSGQRLTLEVNKPA